MNQQIDNSLAGSDNGARAVYGRPKEKLGQLTKHKDFPRSPDDSNQPFYHKHALLSQAAYDPIKYKSNYQQLGYEVDNELSQPSRTVFYNKSKNKAVIAYDGMSMLTRMLTRRLGEDLPAQVPDSKKKDHSPWACTKPLT